MKLNVLCLDDVVTEVRKPFYLLAKSLPGSDDIPFFRAGEQVSFTLRRASVEPLDVTLTLSEGTNPRRALDKISADAKFDLVLVDDNWGTHGETAGQELFPDVLAKIKGEYSSLPMAALFTIHWGEQPARVQSFCDVMDACARDKSRVITGLGKDDPSGLLVLIQSVAILKQMAKRQAGLETAVQVLAPDGLRADIDGIVGSSTAIRAVYTRIGQYSKNDEHVLITGESGTGKELVARAIHNLSNRASNQFIPVNCGAISDALFESEFFGHVKGAFTGAVEQRMGHFRSANMGSIFLDEIGDLPLHHQVKLNRVLQEQEVTPVGGSHPIKIDVRIIAATCKDIKLLVKQEKFRDDLYFRLNVLRLKVPPLRERESDVLELADFLLSNLSSKKTFRISGAAKRKLLEYNWPGNIRELENLIKRAIAVSGGDELGENCFDFESDSIYGEVEEGTESLGWIHPGNLDKPACVPSIIIHVTSCLDYIKKNGGIIPSLDVIGRYEQQLNPDLKGARGFAQHLRDNADDWAKFVRANRTQLESIIPIIQKVGDVKRALDTKPDHASR